MRPTRLAKNYGSSLTIAGFREINTNNFQAGDVAVIQSIPGHPAGHMVMYNGKKWVSDFVQLHGYYPGAQY